MCNEKCEGICCESLPPRSLILMFLQYLDFLFQVKVGKFVCDSCQKVCKSKGGLTRHKKTHEVSVSETGDKTERNILTQDVVFNLFKEEKLKAAQNKCYALEIRKELQRQETEQDCWLTALDLFNAFSVSYKKLRKNGDVEQFYTYCYNNIVINSETHLSDYNQHTATLLLCKMTDRLSAYVKEENPTELQQNALFSLSDKEKHGLRYIGGYILHKLHNKFKNSQNWKTPASQQVIAILNAGKSCDKNDETESSSLMSRINRGGLWVITDNIENIFMTTEKVFRSHTTQNLSNNKIDIQSILQKSITDCTIRSNLQELCDAAELKVEKSVAKDILFSIVKLYVQIRSFSHARDILQKYKISEQKVKTKGLRKEIKRACEGDEIKDG